TYDWLFLRTVVTIGYLGWIAYAVTTVIDMFVVAGSVAPARTLTGTIAFSSILAVVYASFIVSSSPLTYYAYAFFPVVFWEEVYARRYSLAKGGKILFGDIRSAGSILTFLLHTVLYVAVIVSLVRMVPPTISMTPS